MMETLVPFKTEEKVIEIRTIRHGWHDFDNEINIYLRKGWVIHSNIICDTESDIYHIMLVKTEKVKSTSIPPIYLEAN